MFPLKSSGKKSVCIGRVHIILFTTRRDRGKCINYTATKQFRENKGKGETSGNFTNLSFSLVSTIHSVRARLCERPSKGQPETNKEERSWGWFCESCTTGFLPRLLCRRKTSLKERCTVLSVLSNFLKVNVSWQVSRETHFHAFYTDSLSPFPFEETQCR